MTKKNARITLPAEAGQEELVKKLIEDWGVDAIRDSDGTTLSKDILDMDFPIYSTICLVRADQDYPAKHPEHLPQCFLTTSRMVFTGEPFKFNLMENWAKEKYRVNEDDSPKQWWDVIDRTTGEFLDDDAWEYSDGMVSITKARPYHEYTVNFLAYELWDSTSMYNALINNWIGDKVVALDPFAPKVYAHLMEYFENWLEKHPQTNVVRLTSLAFYFTILWDKNHRFVVNDWCGYCETVTPYALQEFEKEYGYALRGDDFIEAGKYIHTNRPPSEKLKDWMKFIQKFTLKYSKDLVDRVHATGKKAALFWGDHWVGAEPFDANFAKMDIDILIGAAEDGTSLRRVSDVPQKITRELRFYPYFFQDVFKPGINPTEESTSNWMKIRRALLRKPVDRIGWGGYLSLAAKFPDFIDHLTGITDEFREFHDQTLGKPAWSSGIHVGVLNVWGALRSWMVQPGPIEKFNVTRADVMSFVGTNITECLAGLPVDISFFSFDDIQKTPEILNNFDVIINEGVMGSAWSGGEIWKNPGIISAIRKWVYNGGGFIGIGHPSACEFQGKIFQLSDVFGFEVEMGQSVKMLGYDGRREEKHFMTDDLSGEPFRTVSNYSYVFPAYEDAVVIDTRENHIQLGCRKVNKGCGVYISSLPFDWDNARLLHRAIFWAAGREDDLRNSFTSNPNTDLAYYPDTNKIAIVNNTKLSQTTNIYDRQGNWSKSMTLNPTEIRWLEE